MPHKDLTAYPIRLRIEIPGTGLGGLTEATEDWLWKHADGHAMRSSYGGIGEHIRSVYLRRIEDAIGFIAAFPTLALADRAPPRQPRPEPGAAISSGHLQRP